MCARTLTSTKAGHYHMGDPCASATHIAYIWAWARPPQPTTHNRASLLCPRLLRAERHAQLHGAEQREHFVRRQRARRSPGRWRRSARSRGHERLLGGREGAHASAQLAAITGP
eukprot:scaffold122101_cov34-Tisochrysis_lutea.AAC.4